MVALRAFAGEGHWVASRAGFTFVSSCSCYCRSRSMTGLKLPTRGLPVCTKLSWKIQGKRGRWRAWRIWQISPAPSSRGCLGQLRAALRCSAYWMPEFLEPAIFSVRRNSGSVRSQSSSGTTTSFISAASSRIWSVSPPVSSGPRRGFLCWRHLSTRPFKRIPIQTFFAYKCEDCLLFPGRLTERGT